MKFSLIAFLTLFVVSCSSDDSGGSPSAADGEFVATVDGTSFRASTQVGATLYNGIFNISAINASTNETIVITVSNAAEGTFNLGPNTNNLSTAVYMKNGQDAYGSAGEGGGGSITITKLDVANNLASGTFNFKGSRQTFDDNGEIITEIVDITDGAFNNIALAGTIPGDRNSTLVAKVDGSDLNADSIKAIEVPMQGNSNISIIANNNSTHQHLSLMFLKSITPGTYNFSGAFSNYIGFYNPNLGGGTNNYAAESGTLTITSYDRTEGIIKGTFRFSAKRIDPNNPDITYDITNGSFTVEL